MTRTALLVAWLAALTAVVAGPRADQATAAPPALSARNAIAVETSTGEAYYARRADERRPMASTTKLMTALVALDELELGDVVPAARYAAAPVESKIGLRTGERMRVADLVRGLLIASANDAAVTLAEAASGSRARFVRAMNRRARALGLADTRFANPIGLDQAGGHSSARDLVALTRAALDVPFIARTVDRPSALLRSGDRPRTIVNRNNLVRRVPWVTGVKTGRTFGAGYVLIGAARKRGVEVVAVVMGAPTEAAREADTLALLERGLDAFRRRTAVREGRVLDTAPVRFRDGAEVELVAGATVRRTVRRGTRFRVRVTRAPTELVGPLRAGTRVGEAEVLVRGRRLAEVPLVTATAVPEATVPQQAKDWITRPLTITLVAIMLLVVLQIAYIGRRRARRRESARRRPRRGMEAA